jgi:hypothetical protein
MLTTYSQILSEHSYSCPFCIFLSAFCQRSFFHGISPKSSFSLINSWSNFSKQFLVLHHRNTASCTPYTSGNSDDDNHSDKQNEWKSVSKKHKGTTRIPLTSAITLVSSWHCLHTWKSPLTSWNNWHMHAKWWGWPSFGWQSLSSTCKSRWLNWCSLSLAYLCPCFSLPLQSTANQVILAICSHIKSTHTSLHTCLISSCNWYTTSQNPDEVKDIVHTQCPPSWNSRIISRHEYYFRC